MECEPIADWDDAYANASHIPGGQDYPERWSMDAEAFRATMMAAGRAHVDLAYGPDMRHRLDLFHPRSHVRGLVVFLHGGFWMRFDKSFWSHLAAGPLALGWCVAMPSYRLCPQQDIAAITADAGRAITMLAGQIGGPVVLAGHSAGGHLVTRMVCRDTPLSAQARARIRNVVSISGVHDLRPLIRTAMNQTLRLNLKQARAESPALLEPDPDCRLVCWVGSAERPEFLRQNALLANVWRGLGAATTCIEEPSRHHFDVIEGLKDPDHDLCRHLCRA